MNLTQANTIGQRLYRRAENVTGVNFADPTFGFTQTDIAATSGSNIGFSKSWLADASRQEVKGVIAHELGHVLQGAGSSLTGVQQEAYGDALRARLGFGQGEGYNSTQENQFDRLSNSDFRTLSLQAQAGNINRDWLKESAMAGNPNGNNTTGPKGGDGRIRNTLANAIGKNAGSLGPQLLSSGGGAALPALTPAQNAAYYNQLGGLYSQYQTTLAGLRSQRMGLKANAAVARQGARAQGITNLAAAENSSIERGVTGSSADLQGRAAVKGQTASDIAATNAQLYQGLSALQNQKAQAAVGLYQGVAGLQSQAAAQQEEQLAQQLQNNLIVSGQESSMDMFRKMYQAQIDALQGGGGNGNGNGPGGPGGPGTTPTFPPGYTLPGYPSADEVYTGYGRNRRV